MLRNTRTGQYLELDARDVFIWNSIDGENTVRDLLFLYAEQYGELALPRIEKTLRTFAAMELVRGLHGQRDQRPSFLRRVGRALFRALLQMKVSVSGLDRLFGRIYTAFGWRLFTRTGVLVMWALIIGAAVRILCRHRTPAPLRRRRGRDRRGRRGRRRVTWSRSSSTNPRTRWR